MKQKTFLFIGIGSIGLILAVAFCAVLHGCQKGNTDSVIVKKADAYFSGHTYFLRSRHVYPKWEIFWFSISDSVHSAGLPNGVNNPDLIIVKSANHDGRFAVFPADIFGFEALISHYSAESQCLYVALRVREEDGGHHFEIHAFGTGENNIVIADSYTSWDKTSVVDLIKAPDGGVLVMEGVEQITTQKDRKLEVSMMTSPYAIFHGTKVELLR